ncbi:MAG: hypothetical protein IJ637_08080 [Prevotella sp.]|nr:hypothetical protein [Prevotella sp.]
MKKTLFISIIVALTTAACGNKQQAADEPADNMAISTHQNAPGDSALYGLACDGSTDSMLVLLPYAGGDPDTFDIVKASKQNRVFGRPHIGDELAVILNPNNRAEALMVINTKELTGDWCYMVRPTLRQTIDNQQMRRQAKGALPDSIRQLLEKQLEYTIRLKADNSATTHGGMRMHTTTDEVSPIEYPMLKRYTEWHLANGQIILKADTISGFSPEGALPESDTATIIVLTKDTLVLQYSDHEQGYYRKTDKDN